MTHLQHPLLPGGFATGRQGLGKPELGYASPEDGQTQAVTTPHHTVHPAERSQQLMELADVHTHLLAGSTALCKGCYSSLCFEAGEGALADTAKSLIPIRTGGTDRAVIAHIALACSQGSHRSPMP